MRSFAPALPAAGAGQLMALPWLDERTFVAPWIGLVIVISLCRDQLPHVAFRRSLLAGVVCLATAFHWFPRVAAVNLQVSPFSGATTSALSVAWDAFRFGVFGYVVAWLKQRRIRTAFVWPVVWVALEWCWPHIFPWRMGHSQLGWLPVCQIAEVTGVYGVSFLMFWVAAVVARSVNEPVFQKHSRDVTVCVAGCAAVIAWGYWRIGQLEAHAAQQDSLRIALIQPGSLSDNYLQRLRDASLAVRGEVNLVVWPESPALTPFLWPSPASGRWTKSNGTPRIAITTSSSMIVKALRERAYK